MTDLSEIKKRHLAHSDTWDDDWDVYEMLVKAHNDRAFLLAHIAEVRDAALEEAAKICEQPCANYGASYSAKIRALKTKPTEEK